MAQAAIRKARKVFHATMQVTRIEEWFVEAATADEARTLLQSGAGQRAHFGERIHFEIDKVTD